MTLNGWLQIGLYCLSILLVVKPLGLYMAACLKASAPSCRRCCGP